AVHAFAGSEHGAPRWTAGGRVAMVLAGGARILRAGLLSSPDHRSQAAVAIDWRLIPGTARDLALWRKSSGSGHAERGAGLPARSASRWELDRLRSSVAAATAA